MKIFFNLLLLALTALLVVVFLYQYSVQKPDKENGFYRKLPPHIVSIDRIFDLGVNSYYVAGFTSGYLYLGNNTVPDRLLKISTDFEDSSWIYIKVPKKDTMWGEVKASVDSPNIFLTQSRNPSLRTATFSTLVPVQNKLHAFNLLDLRPLSATSVIGKVFNDPKQQVALFKKVLPETAAGKELCLDSGKEGIFFSDGMLVHPAGSGYLYYTCFYKNRFMCLDTNLNLIYSQSTIDTFAVPQIRLAPLTRTGAITMASAPRYVNKLSFASDSLLFIQSAVRANNESLQGFKENMVIDVYYSRTGRYLFSFYLPQYKDFKCISMSIHNDIIYAVFDRYLMSVKLHLVNYRGSYN